MKRENFHSSSPWEEKIGYSRAVKMGNIIEVSGTVATDENGALFAAGDAYAQTKFIYQRIEKILHQAGATINDIVRVRMYVTDISRWEEYGRAHHEFFHSIKPCNTMVEVSALIGEGFLVEIEATAITS
jgi:enamine deaminase RidA (YjgF/YER057c/UK114 family)